MCLTEETERVTTVEEVLDSGPEQHRFARLERGVRIGQRPPNEKNRLQLVLGTSQAWSCEQGNTHHNHKKSGAYGVITSSRRPNPNRASLSQDGSRRWPRTKRRR